MNDSINNSIKYFKKALKYFQKGYLDEALDYCEKSISESIKNKSAVGLKALLFYLKGDINSARSLWKLNYEVNDDDISKKYLNDLIYDEDRFRLFLDAVPMVNVLDVNKALVNLKKCCESDFNSINVYNYMALCYISKGDFSNAKKCIDKVLKIDRNNTSALENIKLMKKYRDMKIRFNPKVIAICVAAAIIITGGFFSYKKLKDKFFVQKPKVTYKSTPKKTVPKDNIVVFPYNEVKSDYDNKSYENLYNDVKKWSNQKLKTEEKTLIDNCNSLLVKEGKDYLYNKGCESFKNNDYKNAIVYYAMAKDYVNDNYMLSELYYKLGLSYEINKDSGNALIYYGRYDNEFSSGIYEETVLYRLFALSGDVNAKKSYANKLYKNNSSSIYINNEVMKAIE